MAVLRDLIERSIDRNVHEANTLRRWYVTGADRTVEFVLAHVFDRMELLSIYEQCFAVIDIFPRHDGYFTNEFIRVHGMRGSWRAELCGQPDCHIGEIPDVFQEVLIDHGWHAVADIDENFQRVVCAECQMVHPCDWTYAQQPDTSSYDVVARVVHAARLVLDAPLAGWFVHASLYDSPVDIDEPSNRMDHHAPIGSIGVSAVVDLVEILPLDMRSPLAHRATWPEGSSWAELSCFLECHDLHEGPCPLEFDEIDHDHDPGDDPEWGPDGDNPC
ncbi:MAG: hypothetical protein EB010_00095 [Acidimicrobiia bacterium]|jgi:hypothetical protein|nr:hypothetical protein [Acidimicrobiia bacterium]NDE79376.1 hypothetical protein [Actinomycetota bacterium]NDF30670.1 hypothetical protein [Acidimicrobiia bacterium]